MLQLPRRKSVRIGAMIVPNHKARNEASGAAALNCSIGLIIT